MSALTYVTWQIGKRGWLIYIDINEVTDCDARSGSYNM